MDAAKKSSGLSFTSQKKIVTLNLSIVVVLGNRTKAKFFVSRIRCGVDAKTPRHE